MIIEIPAFSLVALIGVSGSGKTTFAQTHFEPTEIISSDACRALICDDPDNQKVTKDAFDLLFMIANKRLSMGRLVLIDATSVEAFARRKLIDLARRHRARSVAIVLDLPEACCRARARDRRERPLGAEIIAKQAELLRQSLPTLRQEGFDAVHVLTSSHMVDEVKLIRRPVPSNRRDDFGPFDIIGDVHGCYDELVALLRTLGYEVDADEAHPNAFHPEGRRAIFLGDLVDRGPKIPAVLRLVMSMVDRDQALCILGNHDDKLRRALEGSPVERTHGLKESLCQLEATSIPFIHRVHRFIEGLVSHYVLDRGRLVVAHAGLKASLQGLDSKRARSFALYGDPTGTTDDDGRPIRRDWAADYHGRALVVYGHTPVRTPRWTNASLCIDTGCVFGGALSAMRYPEQNVVSVKARRMYWKR